MRNVKLENGQGRALYRRKLYSGMKHKINRKAQKKGRENEWEKELQ